MEAEKDKTNLPTYSLETQYEEGVGSYDIVNGAMFQVFSSKNITVTSLDVHTSATSLVRCNVWTRPGSYSYVFKSSRGWTLVFNETIQNEGVEGATFLSPALFDSVPVVDGDLGQSFYVTLDEPKLVNLKFEGMVTDETIFASNSDLKLLAGIGVNEASFPSNITQNTIWSGGIWYTTQHEVSTPNPKKYIDEDSQLITNFEGKRFLYGSFFDIYAMKSVFISSLDIHTNSLETVKVEVWTKQDTFLDFKSTEWTLVANTTLQGNGRFVSSSIPSDAFETISVQERSTQGFYVSLTTKSLVCSEEPKKLPGESYATNDDIWVFLGGGIDEYPIDLQTVSSVIERIGFNGVLSYNIDLSTDYTTVPSQVPSSIPSQAPSSIAPFSYMPSMMPSIFDPHIQFTYLVQVYHRTDTSFSKDDYYSSVENKWLSVLSSMINFNFTKIVIDMTNKINESDVWCKNDIKGKTCLVNEIRLRLETANPIVTSEQILRLSLMEQAKHITLTMPTDQNETSSTYLGPEIFNSDFIFSFTGTFEDQNLTSYDKFFLRSTILTFLKNGFESCYCGTLISDLSINQYKFDTAGDRRLTVNLSNPIDYRHEVKNSSEVLVSLDTYSPIDYRHEVKNSSEVLASLDTYSPIDYRHEVKNSSEVLASLDTYSLVTGELFSNISIDGENIGFVVNDFILNLFLESGYDLVGNITSNQRFEGVKYVTSLDSSSSQDYPHNNSRRSKPPSSPAEEENLLDSDYFAYITVSLIILAFILATCVLRCLFRTCCCTKKENITGNSGEPESTRTKKRKKRSRRNTDETYSLSEVKENEITDATDSESRFSRKYSIGSAKKSSRESSARSKTERRSVPADDFDVSSYDDSVGLSSKKKERQSSRREFRLDPPEDSFTPSTRRHSNANIDRSSSSRRSNRRAETTKKQNVKNANKMKGSRSVPAGLHKLALPESHSNANIDRNFSSSSRRSSRRVVTTKEQNVKNANKMKGSRSVPAGLHKLVLPESTERSPSDHKMYKPTSLPGPASTNLKSSKGPKHVVSNSIPESQEVQSDGHLKANEGNSLRRSIIGSLPELSKTTLSSNYEPSKEESLGNKIIGRSMNNLPELTINSDNEYQSPTRSSFSGLDFLNARATKNIPSFTHNSSDENGLVDNRISQSEEAINEVNPMDFTDRRASLTELSSLIESLNGTELSSLIGSLNGTSKDAMQNVRNEEPESKNFPLRSRRLLSHPELSSLIENSDEERESAEENEIKTSPRRRSMNSLPELTINAKQDFCLNKILSASVNTSTIEEEQQYLDAQSTFPAATILSNLPRGAANTITSNKDSMHRSTSADAKLNKRSLQIDRNRRHSHAHFYEMSYTKSSLDPILESNLEQSTAPSNDSDYGANTITSNNESNVLDSKHDRRGSARQLNSMTKSISSEEIAKMNKKSLKLDPNRRHSYAHFLEMSSKKPSLGPILESDSGLLESSFDDNNNDEHEFVSCSWDNISVENLLNTEDEESTEEHENLLNTEDEESTEEHQHNEESFLLWD